MAGIFKKNIADKLNKDKESCRKQLRLLMWYHGQINRTNAETQLRKAKGKVGMFLIRESMGCHGDFVLSFVEGKAKYRHYQISQYPTIQGCYSIDDGPVKQGLEEVVNFYRNGNIPAIKLAQPCPGGDLPPPHSISVGYTNILHRYLRDGKKEKAKEIIEHPSHPDLQSKDGEGATALHIAVNKGFINIVSLLLERGANPDIIDKESYTPLHRACLVNNATMARLLIKEGGANPQSRLQQNGNLPIHEAAVNGNIEVLKELLDLNVTAWPKNNKEQTPHELAIKYSHNKCANLLDDHVPLAAKTFKTEWFHEKIDREQAIQLFERFDMIDGMFLVRKSSSDPRSFVLETASNRQMIHYKIQSAANNQAYFIDEGPFFKLLEHLVEYYCLYADGIKYKLQYAITPKPEIKTLDIQSLYSNTLRSSFQRANKTNDIPNLPSRLRSPTGEGVEPLNLPPSSITVAYELGQGEYGSVLKGTYKSAEGQVIDVAIKTLHEEYIQSGKENFLQEAQVMVQFDHPCIVQLVGVSEGPPLMLVQELIALGALLDFLLDYPEKINVRKDLHLWASQVAQGMTYLEEKRFVHRDLAARNILLASKTQAKVGDFGLSRAVGQDSDYYRATKGGRWPVKWYAPESVNYGQFSHASDVWSFGITLWEMYSFGDQPYGDRTGAQVIQFLERNGRLEPPENCPEKTYVIMRNCWQYEPSDRPTFKQLHENFQSQMNYENAELVKKVPIQSHC